MTAHKHAENMLLYAQDAAETETPWERWEYLCGGKWLSLFSNPNWQSGFVFRRKPKTRKVTVDGIDYEFPEPLKEWPKGNKEAWVVSGHCIFPLRDELIAAVKLGIAQATKQGAEAQLKAIQAVCGVLK